MSTNSAAGSARLALGLSDDEAEDVGYDWEFWSHKAQQEPSGDWTTWLLMGGRGSGKTRAGAEWIRQRAAAGHGPIAIVGETITEAIVVMIEGVSGLMAVTPPEDRPVLRGMSLNWPNGVEGMVLGASDPERFRGPQFASAWCDELGCGAVDKGANQPNVFLDPKSAESARPHFSNGAPDPLAQRQVLRAVLDHWVESAMVERSYLWTWDARPWPPFPADTKSWSDGPNHRTGHWLTGRLGGAASDELARAIAADYGIELGEVAALPPFVSGYVVSAVGSARDALAPLLAASGLSAADDPDGLSLRRTDGRAPIEIAEAVAGDGPLVSRRRPDPSEEIGRVALSLIDRGRDYLRGAVTALRDADAPIAGEATDLVLDPLGGRIAAERMLLAAGTERDILELTLPPSLAALEAGDAIAVAGQGDGPFEITEIRDGLARRISTRAIPPLLSAAITSDLAEPGDPVWPVAADPVVAIAHLPPLPETPSQSRLVVAASAEPWPGQVSIKDDMTGASVARLDRPATIGELTAPLGAGSLYRWDNLNTVGLALYAGHLASRDDDEVLAGANRIAIATDTGEWEIIGFAEAELVSPGTYLLSRLLRGQMGTGHAIGPASIGNRLIVLDESVATLMPPSAWIGTNPALRAYAGPADATGEALSPSIDLAPLLPLAPVHLRARRIPGVDDIALSWQRRSRADSDSWVPDDAPLEHIPEAYRVTIFDGATPVRTIEANTSSATYSTAQQTADFGSPPASFGFAVAQRSPLWGPGHSASGDFHG